MLLSVGRLVPRKGIDNVIRALGVLVRRLGVPAELLVVGGNSDIADPASTPEIGRLRAIATEEGVADRVTFTGRRSRELLKLYYSAADAFVTTPWYEAFGMTAIEAMACGTPVVGARVGGIKYSVLDQRTGFLVPPNDPVALADRLKRRLLLAAARGAVRERWRAPSLCAVSLGASHALARSSLCRAAALGTRARSCARAACRSRSYAASWRRHERASRSRTSFVLVTSERHRHGPPGEKHTFDVVTRSRLRCSAASRANA